MMIYSGGNDDIKEDESSHIRHDNKERRTGDFVDADEFTPVQADEVEDPMTRLLDD